MSSALLHEFRCCALQDDIGILDDTPDEAAGITRLTDLYGKTSWAKTPDTHRPMQGLPCDMNADGSLAVAAKHAEHGKGSWVHKLRHMRACWPWSLWGSCGPSVCWLNLPTNKARINEWRGLPFKANCTIQYSAGQATIQGKYPFKIDYHGKPRRQGNYTLDRNFLRWAQMALTTPSQT